jgi:hypothetical protein
LFAAVPEPSLKKAVIYWRAVAAGGLISYLSLSPGEKRAAANAILSRYAKKFAALGAKVMSSGSGESRIYGVILARLASSISQILSGVPGGPPLFPAGGKPVLAGRGLTPVPGLLNNRPPDMAKGALGSGSKSFEAPFRAGAKSVPKAASQATPLAYFPARLPRRAF